MGHLELIEKLDNHFGFEKTPAFLYNPTVFTLANGTDAALDDVFSYAIANKFKNNWYGASAPTDKQDGMMHVDSDDGKAYVQHSSSDEELLQATRSYDRAVQLGMRTTVTKTDNYVVTTADFGKTLVMNSANDKTFTLPSVAAGNVGAILKFAKIGAGKVTIDAADSDTIADSSAGGTIYNNIATQTYATLTIQLVSTTAWSIIEGHGTWVTT